MIGAKWVRRAFKSPVRDCERAQRAGNHIGAGIMSAAPLTAPALSLRPKKPSHPSASVGGLKVFPSASLYMHFASCVYEGTPYCVVPLVLVRSPVTAVGGPIDRAAAGWLGELCSVVIYMGHHSNFGPMGSKSAPTGLGA